MKVLILAGGGGTRLWPLSKQKWPKQFLSLNPDQPQSSLLLSTVDRCLSPQVKAEDIYFITGASLVEPIQSELQRNARYSPISANVITEPTRRNTAPAIALAAQFILEASRDENEVLAILPADHAFTDAPKFQAQLQEAAALAREGYIVTLGITPTHPETGYGYIQVEKSAQQQSQSWFPVERFVEKPNYETACEYLASGNFFWNAGIFVMSLKTIRQAFAQHAPEISALITPGYAHAYSQFRNMPDISIDYAIMERVSNLLMMPLQSGWSDMGSWDNVYEAAEKDAHNNVLKGNAITTLQSNNCLVWSDTNRAIATIGLSDYLVIDTHDALLIAKKGESQQVKNVVQALEARGITISEAPFMQQQPWGQLEMLLAERTQDGVESVAPGVFRVEIQPGQNIRLTVPQLTQGTVHSGSGELEAETDSQGLSIGFFWQQQAHQTVNLVAGDTGLVVLLMGGKPQIELEIIPAKPEPLREKALSLV